MNEQTLIIESLKRKDDAVITRVFQEHSAMVYNVCLGILKNSYAADDAAQATFIALVKRASRLSPSVNLAGWLYHAAVLASKKYREHESRLKARERKASEMKTFQSQSADETWETIREALAVALDSLPVNQRDAIVLTHLEGKTRLEAASVLGAPEGTVAAWIHRGMTKLKERLGAKNRDDRLSVAALGSLLLKHGTQAVPPESLLPSIIKTVTSGIASPTGGDATNGLFLSERVVSAMVWTKMKTYGGIAIAILGVIVAGFGIAFAIGRTPSAAPVTAPVAENDNKSPSGNAELGDIKRSSPASVAEANAPETPAVEEPVTTENTAETAPSQDTANPQPVNGLKFVLNFETTTATTGAGWQGYLSAINVSDRTQSIFQYLCADVLITKPDGTSAELAGRWGGEFGANTVSIDPGDSYHVIKFHNSGVRENKFSADGDFLPMMSWNLEPGEYVIKVNIVFDAKVAEKFGANDVWSGSAISNEVRFTILPTP